MRIFSDSRSTNETISRTSLVVCESAGMERKCFIWKVATSWVAASAALRISCMRGLFIRNGVLGIVKWVSVF